MPDRKLDSIQVLRGIAALAVVASHLVHLERKYVGDPLLLPRFFDLGVSGVDLFFVISGFVMVTVTRGQRGAADSLRFIYSRVTRIYPTYWFYFFATLCVFLVVPHAVNAAQNHQVDLWRSFFLFPSQYLPLVTVGWSLIHELWFYEVFACLLLLPEGMRLFALLIWILVVVAANLMIVTSTLAPTAQIMLHSYTLQFIIGALAALVFFGGHFRNINSIHCWFLIGLCTAILVLGYKAELLYRADLVRPVAFGLGFALLLFAFVQLERRGYEFPKLMSLIGDSSYSLYLSHVLVLSAAGWAWAALGIQDLSPVSRVLLMGGVFVAAVLLAYVAYLLIEKPTLDVFHRLRRRLFTPSKARPRSVPSPVQAR